MRLVGHPEVVDEPWFGDHNGRVENQAHPRRVHRRLDRGARLRRGAGRVRGPAGGHRAHLLHRGHLQGPAVHRPRHDHHGRRPEARARRASRTRSRAWSTRPGSVRHLGGDLGQDNRAVLVGELGHDRRGARAAARGAVSSAVRRSCPEARSARGRAREGWRHRQPEGCRPARRGRSRRRCRASCATTPASRSGRRRASASWRPRGSCNYRPNALARGLRTRRTDTIGLVIPSLDNLGFADVTHGIQAGGRRGQAARPGRRGRGARGRRLTGVADERLRAPRRRRAAWTGSSSRSRRSTTATWRTSRSAASRSCSSTGARPGSAARSWWTTWPAAGWRSSTWRAWDTCASAPSGSAPTRTPRIVGDDGYLERPGGGTGCRLTSARAERRRRPSTAVATGIGRLLDGEPRRSRPTAVFAASLMSALGVRAGLVGAGLRIPEDVSLVAFNDHPIAEHIAPPLTTVRMPNLDDGRGGRAHASRAPSRGCRWAMSWSTSHPPRVIVRGSTAPPTPPRPTSVRGTRADGASRITRRHAAHRAAASTMRRASVWRPTAPST